MLRNERPCLGAEECEPAKRRLRTSVTTLSLIQIRWRRSGLSPRRCRRDRILRGPSRAHRKMKNLRLQQQEYPAHCYIDQLVVFAQKIIKN